jgi:ubiquinone/menaquinone biosynthesis C-methylase UbiE
VPDAIFEEQRLADIYDLLEPERPDLQAYLAIAQDLRAGQVLDIGCGTGTFACLLAEHGIKVTGIDPAVASLDVARRKCPSARVQWVIGDAQTGSGLQVDLVTMTGNVAQVFLTDKAWSSTLQASHTVLRPGGRLVFEVRDPEKKAWRGWTPEQTYRSLELPGVGRLETWTDLMEVSMPFVTFRQHFKFHSDDKTMISESCLRFRNKSEIANSLADMGFHVDEIRDAPDRRGLELVFIASLQE